MADRERLLKILNTTIFPHENVDPLKAVADYLLDNDVLPVVRCKNCAWSMRDDDVYYCINPDGLDNYAKPDDFCSYGERRAGDG